MTNILIRLYDLEIKNKNIIEKKDRFVQKFAMNFGEGVEAQNKVVG
jgi:hypothetical protein